MNEFVEECRQEWKRLHVPDPIANEMAADLEADLKEAEAEGASPEEVLGSGAFDPRSFAASWAAERGVAQPTAATMSPHRHQRNPADDWTCSPHSPGPRSSDSPGWSSSPVSRWCLAATGPRTASRLRRWDPALQSSTPPLHAPMGLIGLLVVLVGIIGLIVTVLLWQRWDNTGRWSGRRHDRAPEGQYS